MNNIKKNFIFLTNFLLCEVNFDIGSKIKLQLEKM